MDFVKVKKINLHYKQYKSFIIHKDNVLAKIDNVKSKLEIVLLEVYTLNKHFH